MRAWIGGITIAAALTGTATSEEGRLRLELNKLETLEGACRLYLVAVNGTATSFDAFQVELVTFDKEGIIGQRIAVELAPLRAGKTVVRPFDLAGTRCDAQSSLLVNDVPSCASAGAPVQDCIDLVETASRVATTLVK